MSLLRRCCSSQWSLHTLVTECCCMPLVSVNMLNIQHLEPGIHCGWCEQSAAVQPLRLVCRNSTRQLQLVMCPQQKINSVYKLHAPIEDGPAKMGLCAASSSRSSYDVIARDTAVGRRVTARLGYTEEPLRKGVQVECSTALMALHKTCKVKVKYGRL